MGPGAQRKTPKAPAEAPTPCEYGARMLQGSNDEGCHGAQGSPKLKLKLQGKGHKDIKATAKAKLRSKLRLYKVKVKVMSWI